MSCDSHVNETHLAGILYTTAFDTGAVHGLSPRAVLRAMARAMAHMTQTAYDHTGDETLIDTAIGTYRQSCHAAERNHSVLRH
jgi:hypothetical protein